MQSNPQQTIQRLESRDDMNTAIATYYHFPISVDSGGYNAILRSNSTYKAQGIQDRALEKRS